ncbi:MAG: D-glycero-beta-D-manno-heptose 1-phosphate adenylyltransferase [Verrucomicrobia bacterium]|nr:D-glycero-beta-D-manno-heptose 1-phosphate adenylyltransferase [Verrucomicrobiota bacterium]
MDFRSKIIPLAQVGAWRERLLAEGRRLVMTNGCFDLLHTGHVTYLAAARALGDALLVGLNSDASVRELKGASRPLNCEDDRALVLAALQCVDGVVVFPQRTVVELLAAVKPDVYVKGGDYTIETLNQDERRMAESHGGKIIILPVVPGKSTTALLEKIARL